MNICNIGYALSPISGHARTAFEITLLLQEGGCRVNFVTDVLDEDGKKLLEKLSRDSHTRFSIKESGECGNFNRLFQDAEFKEMILQADIIHAHDLRSVFFVSKYCKINNFNKKLLYSISSFPTFDLKSLSAGLTVITRLFDRNNKTFLFSLFFPGFLLPWLYSKAHHIVATCDSLKRHIINKGVSSKKISVIYPGVNTKIFEPSPKKNRTENFKILYFGWLSDIRGVSDLLKAFKQFSVNHPKARLVFSSHETRASFSSETKILARKIEMASIKYPVCLIDYRLDINQFLNDCDLVILPFRGRFGYLQPPLTLLETIFKNRVFLTRRLDSIEEIVHESKLLVEKNESLADKISDVFEHYESYQEETERCHNRISRLLNLDTIAEKYLKLFQNLKNEQDCYQARDVYSQKETADTYDKVRFSKLGGQLFDRLEKNVLLSQVPTDKSSRILEVGSGTGRFLISLAQQGYGNLNATDISKALLAVLVGKWLNEGFSKKIPVSIGDIYHLQFHSETMDCIYSIRVLNQLGGDKYREVALYELLRVVKPGGCLIADIVNKHSLAALRRNNSQTSVQKFKEMVQQIPGCRIEKIIHRMSFSQTLMEKAPWPFTHLIYYTDLLFSSLFPFWGTRVYFVIRKSPLHKTVSSACP